MPDLQFIGFTNEQVDTLITEMTPILKALPFSEFIVFILNDSQSKVIQLKGGEAPFLRIFTRCEERATILTEKLKHLCDIEVIYIALFTEKTSAQDKII